MIISPTEPAELRELGRVHQFPELYGCDILVPATDEYVGVQRKEVNDLAASLSDGRLAEQVNKMQGIERRVLIVEGQVPWSRDGVWKRRGGDVRWEHWQMVLWAVEDKGVRVVSTERMIGPCSTAAWLVACRGREEKGNHRSLEQTRGPVQPRWGTVASDDYQRHLLMGLPGMGPKLASDVIEQIGMPLTWKDGVEEELLKVRGVGKKKLATWKEALQ